MNKKFFLITLLGLVMISCKTPEAVINSTFSSDSLVLEQQVVLVTTSPTLLPVFIPTLTVTPVPTPSKLDVLTGRNSFEFCNSTGSCVDMADEDNLKIMGFFDGTVREVLTLGPQQGKTNDDILQDGRNTILVLRFEVNQIQLYCHSGVWSEVLQLCENLRRAIQGTSKDVNIWSAFGYPSFENVQNRIVDTRGKQILFDEVTFEIYDIAYLTGESREEFLEDHADLGRFFPEEQNLEFAHELFLIVSAVDENINFVDKLIFRLRVLE